MKNNKKILKLVEHGLKSSTLAELNEKQIDALYNRLVESKKENKEAVTKTSTTTTFDPSNDADRKAVEDMMGKKGVPMTIDPATKKLTVVTEDGETEEDDNVDIYSDPDASADGMGMFETNLDEKFESKKQQKYFFARCDDDSLSKKERNKWCKMADEFAKSTKDFSKLPEKKKKTKL